MKMYHVKKMSLFLLAVSFLALTVGFEFVNSGEGEEDNESFRNVEIEGGEGSYTVGGEARVPDGVVHFSLEDGHNILVDSSFIIEEQKTETWSPFHLHIELTDEDLPDHGTLTLNLYHPAHQGNTVNNHVVSLESFR